MIGLRRRNPWITHGRVGVVEKQNESLRYEVAGEGNRLEVDVRLDPVARVEVRVNGGVELAWTAQGGMMDG